MSITRADFLRLYKKQQEVGEKYGRMVANTLIAEPANEKKMQDYFQEWLQLEKELHKNISDPTPPPIKGGRRARRALATRRRQTARRALATRRRSARRQVTRRALAPYSSSSL